MLVLCIIELNIYRTAVKSRADDCGNHWMHNNNNNNNNNNRLYFQRVTHLATKYKLIFHEALHYLHYIQKVEQENYSMFLVTCYMEGFIDIWKFKII